MSVTATSTVFGSASFIWLFSESGSWLDSTHAISVQHADESAKRPLCQHVVRVQRQGLLIRGDGFRPISLFLVHPAEIQMRKCRAFVSLGVHGLLEPGDRLVEFAFLDQVGADVVVGVAEFGVARNGAMAFFDRVVEAAHETIGPAQEGMSFGRRMGCE